MASDEPGKEPAPGGKQRKYAAAVCYRVRLGEPEFLLVRARSRRPRWIFPKGGVKKKKDGGEPRRAAEREMLEEAGVRGRARPEPLTCFRYRGQNVEAFLLEFEGEGFDAEPGREPTWFGREEALAALAENRGEKGAAKLSAVLLKASEAVSPAPADPTLSSL